MYIFLQKKKKLKNNGQFLKMRRLPRREGDPWKTYQ